MNGCNILAHADWYVGWGLILGGFVSGALLGTQFYRDHFLGGYMAFRRRILRLGHIALTALGMLNVLYSVACVSIEPDVGSMGLIVGGASMPAICFLTAWRPGFRVWFFVPVCALAGAVIHILVHGPPLGSP